MAYRVPSFQEFGVCIAKLAMTGSVPVPSEPHHHLHLAIELKQQFTRVRSGYSSVPRLTTRDQAHYGEPRSIFIRILLDCADDSLVVETLAVKSGLRRAKLPDIRVFFATVSLHTSALHPILLRRRCGVEESSDIEPSAGAAKPVK